MHELHWKSKKLINEIKKSLLLRIKTPLQTSLKGCFHPLIELLQHEIEFLLIEFRSTRGLCFHTKNLL